MTFLHAIHRHGFVFRELVRRDLQSRYAGSALGALWSFVHPVWQLALFTFVFSWVLRVPLVGQGTERFAIFLFAGLLPWIAVQEAVVRATTAVTDNAALVKRLSFPSEVLVGAPVAAALVHEGIAAAVFGLALLVLGEGDLRQVYWLVPAVILQCGLTVGFGLILAAVHVFFRDTSQLVSILLSGWFYLTPIVYPLSMVPEAWRRWLELNPLVALVGLYRSALLGGPMPTGRALMVLALSAAMAFAAGAAVFRRLRPSFSDEI